MSEQGKLEMTHILVPATCVSCGTRTESQETFFKLSINDFKVEKLKSVQSQYLGMYVCDWKGPCWMMVQKK